MKTQSKTVRALALTMLIGWFAGIANAATVLTSGGAIGTSVPSGSVDIDGDNLADVSYVSFGAGFAALDAVAPYGIVAGDSAFYRAASTVILGDGTGANEAVRPFRGVVFNSSDNWSKVHFTSGDGWVQWDIGADNSVAPIPLVFVLEDAGENLSAFSASELSLSSAPEPSCMLLLGFGGCGLVLRRRRRRN